MSCCSPLLLLFLSVFGYLQLQGHVCLQKSFKPGCLWVSQSHRIAGAGRDFWSSSSPAPLPRQGQVWC